MSKTSKPRADNPIKGIHVAKIRGETYVLRMTWDEIMTIEELFPNGYNPSKVSDLVRVFAVLLAEYQPELDEDALRELSLPVVKVIEAITKVTGYAYQGSEDVPAKAANGKAAVEDDAAGNPPAQGQTEPLLVP